MKKNLFHRFLFGTAALAAANVGAQQAGNVNATAPYAKTNVQTQIRLNVDKDIDAVRFIRDNSDPRVVTKAYILKTADPFEVRPALQSIVQSLEISNNTANTDVIKFNDGYSVLLVSAEENRFGPQPNGQGIDEIIRQFDVKNFYGSSGSSRFLYFPMYRNAVELQAQLTNVGTTHAGDVNELIYGKDVIVNDAGLNALFIFTPQFSKKNIEEMLKFYDNPVPQITVNYVVYEVDDENDGKLGNDYQSWKNADGADLFSVGGNYAKNWSDGGVNTTNGWNKTQYFNTNPKWSTKYLDFLTTEGHARVVTSGEVIVKNNTTALISKNTGLFYDKYTPIADKSFDSTFSASGAITTGATAAGTAQYKFVAKDGNGNAITLKNDFTGSLGVVRVQASGDATPWYNLTIDGGTLVKNGRELGNQTEAVTFQIYQSSYNYQTLAWSWNDITATAFTGDISIQKGNKIDTVASNAYGFNLSLTPRVFQRAATLTVSASNSSLIGWQSDGTPRISGNNQVDAEVQLNTRGTRFVLGGIEKSEVVRSVSGVPFLREIPGLGWVFSSESESAKKSNLLVVAEARLAAFDQPLSDKLTQRVRQLDAELQNGGGKLQWGLGQYGIDADKNDGRKAPAGSAPVGNKPGNRHGSGAAVPNGKAKTVALNLNSQALVQK